MSFKLKYYWSQLVKTYVLGILRVYSQRILELSPKSYIIITKFDMKDNKLTKTSIVVGRLFYSQFLPKRNLEIQKIKYYNKLLLWGVLYVILFICIQKNLYNKVIWQILEQFKFELLLKTIRMMAKENNRAYELEI